LIFRDLCGAEAARVFPLLSSIRAEKKSKKNYAIRRAATASVAASIIC
jgi:hypothetical protein